MPQAMQSTEVPLRQYPSAQTMRQVDGLNVSHGHETVHRSQENNDYDIDRPLVTVHDFQTHHWTPSRRPSTPRPIASSRLNANGAPPLPDAHEWRHAIPMSGPPISCPLKTSADKLCGQQQEWRVSFGQRTRASCLQ